MHAQPNDDVDPYTLYVTADVAPREHNCADSCGRFPGWYLHNHPEDIAAVRATYDGRDLWANGEPEPSQIIFTLKTGREVSVGAANPHLSRLWALRALKAVGIDIMQLVFRPIGVHHEAPLHVKAACKTCTPGPDAASDSALVLDREFRSIARQDHDAFLSRRSVEELGRFLARKHIVDPGDARRAIAAYDDELRACEAQEHGRCRNCKVNRGQHYHEGEEKREVFGGHLHLVSQPCRDLACTRRARNLAFCSICFKVGAANKAHERKVARFRQLERAGATIPKRYRHVLDGRR